jgi:cell division protein FtsB
MPNWRNWQTRYVQGVVLARECGFDSHIRHINEQAINSSARLFSGIVIGMSTLRSTQSSEIRRRTGQFSGIQVMFAAILTIGLFLAIDFSGRIANSQPMQQAYESVTLEIDQLREEQAELIALRDYVRSDAYVELWARADGKLIRPGDVLVIPVPASAQGIVQTESANAAANAIALEDVQTTPPEPDTWTIWWSLFFDQPLPDF